MDYISLINNYDEFKVLLDAAGISPQQAAAIKVAILEKIKEDGFAKRAKDRVRKYLKRSEAKKLQQNQHSCPENSADIHGQSRTFEIVEQNQRPCPRLSADTSVTDTNILQFQEVSNEENSGGGTYLLSSLVSYSSVETELSKKESKEDKCKDHANKKSLVPDDWKAKASHYEAGTKIGLSANEIDELATDMALWSVSADVKRTSRGWDATLHKFIRDRKKPKSFVFSGKPKPLTFHQAMILHNRKVIDDLIAAENAEEENEPLAGSTPEANTGHGKASHARNGNGHANPNGGLFGGSLTASLWSKGPVQKD